MTLDWAGFYFKKITDLCIEIEYYSLAKVFYENLKNGESFTLIWMPRFNWTIENHNTLTHECSHATFKTLDRVDIPVESGKANEAYCYLQAFYYSELLNQLNNEKR